MLTLRAPAARRGRGTGTQSIAVANGHIVVIHTSRPRYPQLQRQLVVASSTLVLAAAFTFALGGY